MPDVATYTSVWDRCMQCGDVAVRAFWLPQKNGKARKLKTCCAACGGYRWPGRDRRQHEALADAAEPEEAIRALVAEAKRLLGDSVCPLALYDGLSFFSERLYTIEQIEPAARQAMARWHPAYVPGLGVELGNGVEQSGLHAIVADVSKKQKIPYHRGLGFISGGTTPSFAFCLIRVGITNRAWELPLLTSGWVPIVGLRKDGWMFPPFWQPDRSTAQ